MLLKRLTLLAAGVLLFILAFIVYFEVSNTRMEQRFAAEREKFNIPPGAILTEAEPATPKLPASPIPAPTSPSGTVDTNTLIGPVPPPATDTTPAPAASNPDSAPMAPTPSAAPDTTTPVPSTSLPMPDTNSAPAPSAPTPSSTMNDSATSGSPYFLRTAFRSDEAPRVQVLDASLGQLPPGNPAPVPAPDAVSTPVAPEPTTAAAVSGSAHPVEGSVIILLYHQFKAAGVPIPAKFQWTLNVNVFEDEMKYIHDNGYHVVSLADVVRFLKHEIILPPGSVCITIDDGYKSAIVYAAPILKKYGYPWTFYIYPQFITTAEGNGAASWNDLRQLQAEGVDIECHSMTHPNLARKGGKTPEQYDAWLTNETAGAKAILEKQLGKPVTSFAYPFGEYNKEVEAKVLAAGFETILTVAGNPVHSTSNPHSLGRYTITQSEVKNFVSDLHQGALGLGDPTPAPGATVTNPRPVISAVIGYAGTLDPNSIETTVEDFDVRHDFDPTTDTVRLYLPRDLIKQTVVVRVHVKDAKTGQVMVANWHFNYEPVGGAVHSPIPATKVPVAPTSAKPAEEVPLEKTEGSTPLGSH
jgi:peptidoglycan/xylan/chitin deacetylase (PgdA/CDA1 family)